MAAGRGPAGLGNTAEREHWGQAVAAGRRKRAEARWGRSRWYWQVLGNCEVVLEGEEDRRAMKSQPRRVKTPERPEKACTIAGRRSRWRSRCDLHPRHLAGHLLHAGRSIVLRVGGLGPRQVHSPVVVLLRDSRPANTRQSAPPNNTTHTPGHRRCLLVYLGGACVMGGGPFCTLPWL